MHRDRDDHRPIRCGICQYLIGMVQQYPEIRRVEITSQHIIYIPLATWKQLEHTILVEVSRTTLAYSVQLDAHNACLTFYVKAKGL